MSPEGKKCHPERKECHPVCKGCHPERSRRILYVYGFDILAVRSFDCAQDDNPIVGF